MARTLEELQTQYHTSASDKKGGMRGGGPGRGHGGHASGGKPKNVRATLGRLLGYIGAYKYLFIPVFLCLLLATFTSLAATYLLAPVLDRLAGTSVESGNLAAGLIERLTLVLFPTDGVLEYLTTGLILLGLAYLLSAACTYIQGKIMLNISQRALRRMRKELFDHVETLPLRYHDTHPTGETMSRFTNDVDNVGTMLDSSIVSVVSGLATIIGTLVFMVATNLILSLVTVIFVPLFSLSGMAIAKRSRRYYSGQQAALGAVNGYIEESVSGQRVVKVFNHEEECVEEFSTLNDDLRGKQFRAQFYGSIMGPVLGNLSKVSYVLTAGIGGVLCILTTAGTIAPLSVLALTFGGLYAFVNYTNHFSRPINEVSMQMTAVFSALAGAERVFAVLDETPEPPDAPDAVSLPHGAGSVAFEHVRFRYQDDVPLIEDMNLKVEPGQRIALVGPTGCGKTTLVNLLMRFYEINSGTLRVDGHPIDTVTRDSLRANLGMVLQETWLKAGTIAENIAYGKPDATREEIIAAAKKARAHSFICRLPNGYDTQVAEDGGNISQGQRQLLCIARVMLRRPPILILDEATSSIDTRTEVLVQDAFEELMKGRTSFIVAHRLSTIKNADQILVMKAGNIIERGTHDELLAQGGFYKQLYESQFAKA